MVAGGHWLLAVPYWVRIKAFWVVVGTGLHFRALIGGKFLVLCRNEASFVLGRIGHTLHLLVVCLKSLCSSECVGCLYRCQVVSSSCELLKAQDS